MNETINSQVGLSAFKNSMPIGNQTKGKSYILNNKSRVMIY